MRPTTAPPDRAPGLSGGRPLEQLLARHQKPGKISLGLWLGVSPAAPTLCKKTPLGLRRFEQRRHMKRVGTHMEGHSAKWVRQGVIETGEKRETAVMHVQPHFCLKTGENQGIQSKMG